MQTPILGRNFPRRPLSSGAKQLSIGVASTVISSMPQESSHGLTDRNRALPRIIYDHLGGRAGAGLVA